MGEHESPALDVEAFNVRRELIEMLLANRNQAEANSPRP